MDLERQSGHSSSLAVGLKRYRALASMIVQAGYLEMVEAFKAVSI